jgi:Uma2 family endonuclease
MRLPTRGREPDLMIIMNDNPHPRTRLYLDGPADIVSEIVSPGSERTDLGDKFVEYEAAGVREYWIVDHVRRRTYFYRLDDEGHFILHLEDADGVYITPLLPKFKLHVPTLWQETLPDYFAIGDLVKRTWEGE